jgi:CheY-like chemotaxis protein
MSILVVDDEDDIRETVGEVLHAEGYETVGAPNGQEAKKLLERARKMPRLILLDLMMPVMDGWDFLMWLEGNPRTSEIPVAIMSAHPSIERALKVSRTDLGFPHLLLHGGVRLLLPKPLNFLRLLELAQDPTAGGRVPHPGPH